MKDQTYNDRQELAFYKALQSFGFAFPEADNELMKLEEMISQMKISIPEKFSDPISIIERGNIEKISHFEVFHDKQIEENLSQAAREGSNISNDVWEQMEKDRKEAEKRRDEEQS
ncbi:MAG: hypothetical protein ABR974_05025 [Bacteroidales bacterium]|jgi:hypothetical protein